MFDGREKFGFKYMWSNQVIMEDLSFHYKLQITFKVKNS